MNMGQKLAFLKKQKMEQEAAAKVNMSNNSGPKAGGSGNGSFLKSPPQEANKG